VFHTEVRALYGRLSLAAAGWLHATQLGATAAARPVGAFSTGVPVDWVLSQRPACVDCGFSYTTGQTTIAHCGLFSIIP